MEASSNHQKQKLPLLKRRRLARSIVRQFIPLPQSPLKRIGIVSASILTGVGVPAALVFAAQQPNPETQKTQSTGSSTVTIHSTTSSQAEGASSLQGFDANASDSTQSPNANTQVVINGESVPLTDGTVSQEITNNSGTHVDINVTIDHSTTSSSSSSTTTDISIDSSSSSSSDDQNPRGSPRR